MNSNAMQQLVRLTQRPSRMLSELADVQLSRDVEIHGICDDSRHVRPGDAFLCLPRAGTEAPRFVQQAADNGAVAVISVGIPKLDVLLPCLQLADMPQAGQLLRRWFGTEESTVRCIGVTGTDGKTSVTWMLREALAHRLGDAWGCGTLGWIRTSDDIDDIGNTTPSMLTLHRLLAAASQENIPALVMEVSSHGIDQQRIAGIPFSAAVWTTLGHDHLQDHGSFDAYAALKTRFVRAVVDEGGIAVCNMDQPQLQQQLQAAGVAPYWYAHGLHRSHEENADIMAWEQELPGLARLACDHGEVLLEEIPAGEFHAENLAAVAQILHRSFDVPLAVMSTILNGISAPPGRMQGLDIGRWQVFIDYAHTPEALERCLTTARNLTRERLMVVFGCGGNRDREKRPEMGRIASELADAVWITSDNPRQELPEVIASEIENGIPHPYPAEIHLQLDRKLAIGAAIETMRPGDTLVIAGKGHENYMEVDGIRTPWSDFNIASDLLHAREERERRQCA